MNTAKPPITKATRCIKVWVKGHKVSSFFSGDGNGAVIGRGRVINFYVSYIEGILRCHILIDWLIDWLISWLENSIVIIAAWDSIQHGRNKRSPKVMASSRKRRNLIRNAVTGFSPAIVNFIVINFYVIGVHIQCSMTGMRRRSINMQICKWVNDNW